MSPAEKADTLTIFIEITIPVSSIFSGIFDQFPRFTRFQHSFPPHFR
jgi:hypothetical protein